MSEVQKSVQLLADTLASKNQDYTAGRGEFYNFERTAEFINVSVAKVIVAEIAKKMTRLESLIKLLESGVMPSNESMKDTLLDLAGYGVIAHAHLSAEENDDNGYTNFPLR